ncbi:GrpE, mitochondrial [Sorochytrium milnesiophthora]
MLRTIAVSATAALHRLPARRAPASLSRYMSTEPSTTSEQQAATAESPTPDAAAAAASAQQLQDKDRKIAELTDHYRRALAETENVRERSRRDVDHAQQFAVQKFSKDMLNIADVLSMALSSVPAGAAVSGGDVSAAFRNLHDGLTLTHAELLKTFARHGVERIETKEGDAFDPNVHHALFEAPVPNRTPGTILQVAKQGFKLNGRVLRPAQVGVVKSLE